jgi:hypothetical protein
MEFFSGEPDVTLRPGQGLVVHLAAAAAAAIPVTDFFITVCDWEEYTVPA